MTRARRRIEPVPAAPASDIADARRVAETLGIPHYVLNYEDRFRKAVIDPFAQSYVSGETPIPCVSCNQTVKFADLLATAKELGAATLATGHYIRSQANGPHRALFRPVDADRDQSYFLFATTQEQIDYLRFPLGRHAKAAGSRGRRRRWGCPSPTRPTARTSASCRRGDIPTSSPS